MQPSGNGELHIGNYLGAAKQWVDLQNDHDAFYMIVDLHAITVPYEPAVLKENIYKIAALYLALGVDPAKSTIFVQSHLPAHSEMAWLLNTITSMGELNRMTQFKDKGGESENSSAGLFNYPVLMAADILLYQANLVPVGEDQKQHLELTRNLAERFNSRFGQTFTVPDYYAPENAARIMGLDNPAKKMSKSLGPDNYIGLLDDSPRIREKLKKAVTDSDGIVRFDKENKPAISNLLTIFSAVSGRSVQDLEQQYASSGYGVFKDDLAEATVAFLTPIQERYNTLINDKSQLDAILNEGAEKAATVASATLAAAQTKMGLR
jgi:tryptophanyl-tRNA synthetase